MAATISPSNNSQLAQFAAANQGNLDAAVNFIVDNNFTAVSSVLRANGFTFSTMGEAAVIVKALLLSSNATDQSTVAQLQQISYNNSENVYGTGGAVAPSNQPSTQTANDLLCIGLGLFGIPLASCGTGTNPAVQPAPVVPPVNYTPLIVGGVLLVVVLLVGIYLISKPKA